MLCDVRGKTYEEKLNSAGLTTLAERRARGDMIETFKTMRGFNRVNREEWFKIQVESEHRPTRMNTIMVDGEPERRKEKTTISISEISLWFLSLRTTFQRSKDILSIGVHVYIKLNQGN